MNNTSSSGITDTPWLKEQPQAKNSLDTNIETPICIIGAGISGLSTAYHLTSPGKKVVVIDAGLIGSGESGRTTAHLTDAFDDIPLTTKDTGFLLSLFAPGTF